MGKRNKTVQVCQIYNEEYLTMVYQRKAEMGYVTIIPKLFNVVLYWDKWRRKQKPRIQTQIWYADVSKGTTGFGAGKYGETLNHKEYLILGQYLYHRTSNGKRY